MSGSQELWSPLLSVADQESLNLILGVDIGNTNPQEIEEYLGLAEQILWRMAQYSQPLLVLQRVCSHPKEIALLQRQLVDLQIQQHLPPPDCDRLAYSPTSEGLQNDLEEARRISRAEWTAVEIRQPLDAMTNDIRQSVQEVFNSRM